MFCLKISSVSIIQLTVKTLLCDGLELNLRINTVLTINDAICPLYVIVILNPLYDQI
jgi:hypothetical protein